jgi:nicotinate-nucleotide adenylyltransferase
MKTIGVYGGSFDPIHIGHLVTTRFVYEQRDLGKIIFMPCNISPLKTSNALSSPEHRLKMLELALEPFPFFEVSDYEILKGDVSYTLDTLLELKKTYDSIELIIGYDNLVIFDKWHEPEKILDIAKLIVMKRKTDDDAEVNNKFMDSAFIINTPSIEISATDIRNRILNGRSIDYLVPRKVNEYIQENRLYTKTCP